MSEQTIAPQPRTAIPEAPLAMGDPRTLIAGLPNFWERVRQARHRLLAIDYDGTLAPFRVAREQATPLEGVKEALCQIRDHPGTSVAILTGRPAHQILELMGRDLHISILGAHGYEQVHADGSFESFPPTERQEQGLTKAIALTVDAGFAETLEKKSASIALHTRGMSHPDEIELRFMELWRPIAEEHRLSVMRFNRGVELHALGRSKGVALADLYRQMPPDTLPVYIGDDTTDEDAFHYVKSHGLGIKVGLAGATEATGRVPDEAAVLAILRDWLHVTAAPE